MSKGKNIGVSSAQRAKAALVLLAAAASVTSATSAFAASASWSSTPTNNEWEASATDNNWSTGVGTFPGTTATSSSDVATFNATSSQTNIDVATNLTIGNITFDTAAASAYTISGARLRISNAKNLTMTSTVANPQAINTPFFFNGTSTIANNAADPLNTFKFGGTTMTFSNSTTTAVITLSGTNTGLNTISNAIQGAATATASMSLIKTGTGTWVLGGTNTFGNTVDTTTKGSTRIDGGLLAVTGSLAASSAVLVNAAGTLGGTGIINGATDNFGTVAPGVNNAGSTSFGSTLTFESGSFLAMDLGPTATTADSDLVNFTTLGNNLIGSGNATLALGGTIDYTKTYTIFQNVSTSGFTFASITGYDAANYAASLTSANNNYSLSFTPTNTPEPAALSLLSLAGVSLLRRRR